MKSRVLVVLTFFAFPFAPIEFVGAAQENSRSTVESPSLESIVEQLAAADDLTRRKATAFRAAVEAEAAAKRVSEINAEELRWTAQRFESPVSGTQGSLLTGARLPAENKAIMNAESELGDQIGLAKSKRSALMPPAVAEVRRRTRTTVLSSRTSAEIHPLLRLVKELDEDARKHSEKWTTEPSLVIFRDCARLLGAVARTMDCALHDDAEGVEAGTAQIRTLTASVGDIASFDEAIARIREIQALPKPKVENGHAALDTALELEEPRTAKLLLSEMDSIPPQITVELALYGAEVRAGTEKEGWTEERRISALQSLDEMLTPDPKALPNASEMRKAMSPGLRDFLLLHRKDSASKPDVPHGAPEELAVWLAARIQSLSDSRTPLVFRYAEEVIPFAEEVWIHAKTTADLKPAAAALGAIEKRDPEFLTPSQFVQMGMPMRPNIRDIEEIRNETFEIWLLASSTEPFFLPEPESDPEGFWKAREIWVALKRARISLVTRARPAAHFNTLNRRFREALASTRGQVEQSILKDAPPDRLESALKRLHTFGAKPFNLIKDALRFQLGSGPPVRNYRDALARSQFGVPMIPAVMYGSDEDKKDGEVLSKFLAACDALLELQKAEDARVTGEKLRSLREHLSEVQANFPEAVRSHLIQRSMLRSGDER